MRRLLIAAFLLAALPAAAGTKHLTLRQRVTTGGLKAEPRESTQYWSGNKTVNEDQAVRTITDLDAKTLTVVHKQQKTYAVVSFDALRAQSEAVKRHLPREVQDLENIDSGVTLKPTGKTEEIAGYQAKEYAIEGAPYTGSVWVAEAIQMPASAGDFVKLSTSMGRGGPLRGHFGDAVVNLKGVPLRIAITMVIGPRKSTMTTEVLEVSQKAPPADVLKVPDGFTKVQPRSHENQGNLSR